MHRGFFFALFLSVGLLWANPDSLVVSTSGVKSDVGVWWPKNYKAPVTVWFHGGMSSGNCSKGLVAGDDFAKIYPDRIVVSASACKQNHWATQQMINAVDAALDSVALRRKSPVEQVDLVGISDGSLGVIMYSYLGKRSAKNRLLMSSYGGFLGEPNEIAAVPKLQSGRWTFLQGGSDRLYPSDKSVPWIESFCKGVKVECELKFDEKGEHDWQYWKTNRHSWIDEAIFDKTP